MRIGTLALLTLFSTAAAVSAAEKPNPKGVAFFEKNIRPVLVKNCYQCHSAESKKPKGGLLVDSLKGLLKGGETGHAVVPGKIKESLLIDAIKHTGDVSEMPPKQKLPDEVIRNFEQWVKMGAPYPQSKKLVGPRKIDLVEGRKFWAFVPPKSAPIPNVANAKWPRTDVDRYLLSQMEKKGLSPVRDADKVTLIRRATFDLTGLPPTPAEVEDFLKDTSANAFEKVIDRLLKSKQFGERWGRHWLDVVRYAESTGKERNYPYQYAWRYRNYVIDSMNADKPYDQFIREQIAGDLLPSKTPEQKDEQIVATGFLAIGPKSLNERNRLKFEMDVVDDQIDVTGRAILGITIACARCHDHKFDPIPTKDYYALAGIYRSSQVQSGVRGRRARAGTTSGYIALHAGGDGEKYQKHQQKVQKLQRELRQKIIQVVRQDARGGKGKKNRRKLNKKQLQRLAQRMQAPVIRKNDPPQLVKLKKEVTQLIADYKKLQKNAPPAPAVAMGVQEGQRVVNSPVFIKGEVDDQGEVVPRGFVQVAMRGDKPKMPSDASGRLELATWLTAKQNPLTARVAVNRIWQHLFGVGIVKTVDNFGHLGERPVNPELLDYLALRFMKNGWSTKSMIKELMLTRAYQLSSEHKEANYTADPENRLAWRASRRRLDAESIRDAILTASGQLDLKRPASSPIQRIGQGEIGRQVSVSSIAGSKTCRSVYLPIVRQAMPEMMRVFDVADPSLVVGERDVTTVPTQALFMMNSPFVIAQSEAMAKRLFDEKGMDDVQRVELAYQLTLSRKPTKRETDRVVKFLTDYRTKLGQDVKAGSQRELAGWAAFCQTLFASAEFRYLY